MGDFNDWDVQVPDHQGNIPSSRAMTVMKDPNEDGSFDLHNVAAKAPQIERGTEWCVYSMLHYRRHSGVHF